MRQPPLVNRRSSVNRLVNRQPVDAGERFASDCVIRHTVFAFRDSPQSSPETRGKPSHASSLWAGPTLYGNCIQTSASILSGITSEMPGCVTRACGSIICCSVRRSLRGSSAQTSIAKSAAGKRRATTHRPGSKSRTTDSRLWSERGVFTGAAGGNDDERAKQNAVRATWWL